MTILSLPHLPIQEIISLRQSTTYQQSCVEYLGSPRKHPSDLGRMILVTGVLENQQTFLEFRKEDVGQVDEAQTISSQNGENIRMVTLWVKKGSLALELRPFRV